MLAETDASGNTVNEYLYFGGARIARRDASGNVYYYFPDSLGSEVSITNATGTPCFDADFYLFGGEKVFTNNCPPSYKFAGMERDSETGLDHTLFRQYSSQFGRWLTPDSMGGDVTNPQSLNRYAYVLNNPTSLTDPLGLFAGNPADQCNGGDYTDARCQGPPGCSWLGDPNCCAGPDIGGDNAELCYPMSGNFPPLNPWNPLPAITQPTATGQLGSLGIGGSCEPFGCVNDPFQNFYQAGEWAPFWWELVKELGRECIKDPHACERIFLLIGAGLRYTWRGVKAEANASFGCTDAPCIQRALGNIKQQQLNGTWETGPKEPVVVAKQPTIITVTAQPNPKNIVPVH